MAVALDYQLWQNSPQLQVGQCNSAIHPIMAGFRSPCPCWLPLAQSLLAHGEFVNHGRGFGVATFEDHRYRGLACAQGLTTSIGGISPLASAV